MDSIVKPYLFRASLSAAIAVGLGILLSLVIYISSDLVRDNNIDLVKNRLPVLTSINLAIADISEQERIIAQYYASQNEVLFIKAFNRNKESFYQHSVELIKHPMFSEDFSQIQGKQEKIEVLALEFSKAMQLANIDWDYLRALLAKISKLRLEMLPILQRIEQQTKKAVTQGHQQVLEQMDFIHKMVIFYALSILFLAGIIAWHIRKHVLTTAENSRLALFPKLNPNPILSVNNLGELVFYNPACQVLLQEIGENKNNIVKLIPSNFADIRKKLSAQNKLTMTIEQTLNTRVLQLSVNWLVSIDAYDIHIMDITERKHAEQKVNHLAFYVQETNLPNQYKLQGDVELLIEQAKDFSFGLFEIRNFNRLVTAQGINAIEELVKSLTQAIVRKLPEKSYLYHLNQNQFALLYHEETSIEQINRLINAIDSFTEEPVVTNCGDFFVEFDFGFSLSPVHGQNYSLLYKNAHTALNVAAADKYKNSTIFNDEFAQVLQNSATMVHDLANALKNKELFLVFQPQLSLSTHQVSGIETLVRWQHKGEVISPVEFIPLAEQSGLIVPIGHWILTQACLFAQQLITQGHNDIIVAVNVSPRQFSHPDFVQSVSDVLAQTQLPAKNLELEITEGVFMHNEFDMLKVLNQLKALGLHLSIDDFGTGYSSLSYLKKFPIDKLKIDQSFIRNCHENEEDKVLVSTIVSLGKSLGMSLIAEGVEEVQHLTYLQDLQCDEIQGYWFSKPLIADDLIIFLDENVQKNALKKQNKEKCLNVDFK